MTRLATRAAWVAVTILIPALPAAAVDVMVTAGAVDQVENSNCSLVEAFQAVNSGGAVDACPAGGDRIVLPAGSDFLLTAAADAIGGGTGLPALTADVEVVGNGATIRRDGAAPRFRLLWVAGVAATLRDLTLQGGRASDSPGVDGSGGGVYNDGGDLLLENVQLYTNSAAYPDSGDVNPSTGGGLTNTGSAELRNCQVAFNNAYEGGAVWSNDTLTLVDTWIFNNHGRYAVYTTSSGARLTVRGSLIANNQDAGIKVTGTATARISNSTLSGNKPLEGAGALIGGGLMAESSVTLTHVTVTGNRATAGSGVWVNPVLGELTLANTLIAGNLTDDCSGAVVSEGGNLLGDGAGCSGIADGVGGDTVGVDPLLGPLADNGGPTRTHLPGPGSPALDAAGAVLCLPVDQRGVARPQGAGCDVGATEVATAGTDLEEIPTVGEVGLASLVALLAGLGLWTLRRRPRTA